MQREALRPRAERRGIAKRALTPSLRAPHLVATTRGEKVVAQQQGLYRVTLEMAMAGWWVTDMRAKIIERAATSASCPSV